MNPTDSSLIARPESRTYDFIVSREWNNHQLGPLHLWPKHLINIINCLFANPNPMLVLWGDELFQFYNDAYHHRFSSGQDHSLALGESARLKQHCAWTNIEVVANQVFAGKVYAQQFVKSHSGSEQNGNEEHYHFNFTPIWDSEAQICGVLACGNASVPDHAAKPYKIQEHCEKHLAMAVLTGTDMSLDFASDKIMQYWSVGHQDIGKPILNAMPNMETADYYGQLRGVFSDKKSVRVPHQVVSYQQDGKPIKKYVDFCFDPCLNEKSEVTDVIVSASDVTYKVAARRKIKLSENETFDYTQRLEMALQAGHLGCYELFLSSGQMICTDQCKANYGLDPTYEFSYEGLMNCILPEDRRGMQQAVETALQTRSDYHAQYRVIWPDQSMHWISASGRALCNSQGTPVKMVGVTLEITKEKSQQQLLEKLVELRTQELTEANDKLRSANKKVSENMKELSKSNANLEGFAFTASHDLQEPLRKIQAFGSMLKQKLSDQESMDLIDRMQGAGQRMSVLITGLLNLSRMSVEHKMYPVNLNEAVQLALDALELKISETSAVIQVDHLHIVNGDLSQLTQLFQNLIGNSLRFISRERKPVIRISCSPVLASEIPVQLLPTRVAEFYHQIVLSDNGIGFAPEDAEKIFEVFKRLHGRGTYEGTGIGLSICKQVVDNHNGIIYANGQPGVGATFTILLPMTGGNH